MVHGEERCIHGCVGEGKRPAPDHRARPTTNSATSRRGPFRPCAEELLLTMASAIGDLLGALEVADPAAVVRHLLDRAVAVPLALAARTVAPVGPLTPNTVLAVLNLARLGVARLQNSQPGVASLAATPRQSEDFASALPLASAAGARARAPIAPLAESAVRRAWGPATLYRLLSVAWVAGGSLLERCIVAGLAIASGKNLDVAVALVRPVACARAERPLTPVRHHAVRILHALGQPLAMLVFVLDAICRPPTLVRVLLDAPAAYMETTIATGCAALPIVPIAPLAVDALLATWLSVAGHCLALRQRLAGRASVPRQRLQCSHPTCDASSATGGARRPIVPLAPCAVRLRAHSLLPQARQSLVQCTIAANAELLPKV